METKPLSAAETILSIARLSASWHLKEINYEDFKERTEEAITSFAEARVKEAYAAGVKDVTDKDLNPVLESVKQKARNAAMLEEREACAKVVHDFRSDDLDWTRREKAIEVAIRQRTAGVQ